MLEFYRAAAADRRSPERLQTMSHWRTEIECHAAFQEGGAELDWGGKGITADDAKWIASALANPAVRSTCNPHSVRDECQGNWTGSDTALP